MNSSATATNSDSDIQYTRLTEDLVDEMSEAELFLQIRWKKHILTCVEESQRRTAVLTSGLEARLPTLVSRDLIKRVLYEIGQMENVAKSQAMLEEGLCADIRLMRNFLCDKYGRHTTECMPAHNAEK